MSEQNFDRIAHLKGVHGMIVGWIASADSKAAVVIGFGSIALGWLIADGAKKIEAVGPSLFCVATFLLVGGILCGALTVFPVLRFKGKPQSMLFFKDISGLGGPTVDISTQADNYLAKLKEEGHENGASSVERDYSAQIIVNSLVACRKFRFLKLGFTLVLLGLFFAVGITFFSQI